MRLNKLVSLLLALALLCPALGALAEAPEAFALENGVTWQSTLEEVEALDGFNSVRQTLDDGMEALVCRGVDALGFYAVRGYVFQDDRMVFIECGDFADDQGRNADQLHELIRDALEKLYGEPKTRRVETALDLVEDITGVRFPAGTVAGNGDALCWSLGDGTRIFFSSAEDGNGLLYLNGGLADSKASAPEAFALENGVTWQSTMEDVAALPDVNDEPNAFETLEVFTAYNTPFSGFTAQCSYAFAGGVLVGAELGAFQDDAGSSDGEVYDLLRRLLTDRYGEPDESSAEEMTASFARVTGFASEAPLSDPLRWSLADGTLVYLCNTGGSDLIYLNGNYTYGAAPVPEAFSFRGGVTWATNPDDLRALEDADGFVTQESGFTLAVYEDAAVSDFSADLAYAFDAADRLFMVQYLELKSDRGLDDAAIYQGLARALTGKYGEARESTQEEVNAAFKQITGQDGEEELSDPLVWELADGTWVVLCRQYRGCGLVYLNTAYTCASAGDYVPSTDGL